MSITKVTTKIRMGFLVMTILPLILGLVAWLGVESLQASLQRYADWGEIDMVMNEDVTQKLLKLENALLAAQFKPDKNNKQNVAQAFSETLSGLEQWSGLVKKDPELSRLADLLKQRLSLFKQRFELVSQTQISRKKILNKWDQLVEKTLAFLEKNMEEVIDPNKEKVAQARNIEGMNLWGDIDMIMNEEVIANFLKLQTAIHDYVACENAANKQEMLKHLDAAKVGLEEWKKVLAGEKEMETVAETIDRYLSDIEILMGEYESQANRANKALSETNKAMRASIVELERGMEELIDPAKERAVKVAQKAQEKASFEILVVSLLAIIFGVFFAWGISRSILRPLTRVIAGLSAGSQQVATAAGQVRFSSQNLAQGSGEQAANLEEISASMEQMSSMTSGNADNANQANLLMENNGQVFEQANNSMAELKNAIQKISNASDDTAKIIKTINEIAFQTNLLALNAAVEAARAGEAGAGFAVVSDEVRSLAMRTADAAKSTAQLIEENLKDIEVGSKLVTKTENAFSETAESTSKITELVAEIASASSEQSQGIEQVNRALAQLSGITQNNAASAEESATASRQLDSEASSMDEYVIELAGMIGEGTRAANIELLDKRSVNKPKAISLEDR